MCDCISHQACKCNEILIVCNNHSQFFLLLSSRPKQDRVCMPLQLFHSSSSLTCLNGVNYKQVGLTIPHPWRTRWTTVANSPSWADTAATSSSTTTTCSLWQCDWAAAILSSWTVQQQLDGIETVRLYRILDLANEISPFSVAAVKV